MARATVGRTMGVEDESLYDDIDLAECEITLTDEEGNDRSIFFNSIRVKAGKVKANTFVNAEVNGRDQNTLTPESVADITRTIKTHQWFPAIGRFSKDGKIEILDGSRRRLAAIEAKTGLNILVAEEDVELTTEDARAIANEVQTAREHSIRDLGTSLLPLWESGMKQADIAKARQLSVAKVNRALTAGRVPLAMIKVFPDPNELSHPNYNDLLKYSEQLKEKDIDLPDLLELVQDNRKDILKEDLRADEIKSRIMASYKDNIKYVLDIPAPVKAKTTHYFSFDNKNQFARKRTRGRAFAYEFGYMPKSVQQELDKAIEGVLNRHYEEEKG
ncbi:hypothetical protein GZ77_26000 [Endozoicomonas montiporae]|uniref:ParB-like N-terminal domain-containing protein n=1 Tax=Endozoicomonas montiporae TaxID=1027273 RepID=A0A081MYR4_9GAMM|nr:ParB family protein [Endozoicomonas montiporae]KEQ11337.1 hypothetical protein GZ77_26000 [Endozoicomonas montiporae]